MDDGEFTAFFLATTPMLLRYVSSTADMDVAQHIVAETMTMIWKRRPRWSEH